MPMSCALLPSKRRLSSAFPRPDPGEGACRRVLFFPLAGTPSRRERGSIDKKAKEHLRIMTEPKTSVVIWAFGPNVTRFVPPGYHPEVTNEDMVARTHQVVEGLTDLVDGLEY